MRGRQKRDEILPRSFHVKACGHYQPIVLCGEEPSGNNAWKFQAIPERLSAALDTIEQNETISTNYYTLDS